MSDTPKIDTAKTKLPAIGKEQQELIQSRLISSQFGNIVTVMMQSPGHKKLALEVLQSRIVPPLLNQQFRLAEASREGSGQMIPVALIIWAQVSGEVHKRISDNLEQPIDLAKDEWKSGDNYWIIDAIGPERFLAPLMNGLREGEFKDKVVYFKARGKDGPEVKTLDEIAKMTAERKDAAEAAKASTKAAGSSDGQKADAQPPAAPEALAKKAATKMNGSITAN